MGEIIRLQTPQLDRDELHAYVDGRLDSIRANRVALQLVMNGADARRARSYSEQNRAMRRLFAIPERPIPPRIASLAWRLGRRLLTLERHMRIRRLAIRSAAAAIALASVWYCVEAQFHP
jgi:anti-sigma factor RsiW